MSRSHIRATRRCTKTPDFKATNRTSCQEDLSTEKKPKGKELTKKDKATNRMLSSIRVAIEHALSGIKRCRCVKDTLRNTKPTCSDDFMVSSTGLHNLRIAKRKRPLRR